MNIYTIIFDSYDWDQYIGFVIAAKSEQGVLDVIQKELGRYLSAIPIERGYNMKKIGNTHYRKPKILFESFNAG